MVNAQIVKTHIFLDQKVDHAAFGMALKAMLDQHNALDFLLQLASTCSNSQVSAFFERPRGCLSS